jgi:hypothetical protein
MAAAPAHDGTPAGQNGKPLPFEAAAVAAEDLQKLSVEQLTELANRHHRGFLGCVRGAFVEHARLAGGALLLLKSRLEAGGWGDWLKANFVGSPETARLYMRVARHWPAIQGLGLDREDITLEELRWVLSDSNGPPPGHRGKPRPQDADAAAEGEKDNGDGGEGGGEDATAHPDGPRRGRGPRSRPDTTPAQELPDDGMRLVDFGDPVGHLTVTAAEVEELGHAAGRLRRHGEDKAARVAFEAVLAAGRELAGDPVEEGTAA